LTAKKISCCFHPHPGPSPSRGREILSIFFSLLDLFPLGEMVRVIGKSCLTSGEHIAKIAEISYDYIIRQGGIRRSVKNEDWASTRA